MLPNLWRAGLHTASTMGCPQLAQWRTAATRLAEDRLDLQVEADRRAVRFGERYHEPISQPAYR
jgi:hypothetical protein